MLNTEKYVEAIAYRVLQVRLTCNRWALEHNDWADIVVEAKSKNLASHALLAERVTS